jgi:hypothetical protein
MPVPISAMSPIAINKGMTWIGCFDHVYASRGIGMDWGSGTTSICGVRKASEQVLFHPGGKQMFHKQNKFQEKTNTECYLMTK